MSWAERRETTRQEDLHYAAYCGQRSSCGCLDISSFTVDNYARKVGGRHQLVLANG